MNITKMKQKRQQLLDYMNEKGYHPLTVKRIEYVFEKLFCNEGEYTSYPDFFEKFISAEGLYSNDSHEQHLRHATRLIQAFDEYDHLPTKMLFAPVLANKGCYRSLCEEFKRVIDYHRQSSILKGRNKESVKGECNNASRFFYEMQCLGAFDLQSITERMILSFFYDGTKSIRGCAYKVKVCSVLKSTKGTELYQSCMRIILDMPSLRKERKLFDILAEDEVLSVKRCLHDNISLKTCSKRDKAIISVAMYTGMRGSDIAQLTIQNIDWDNEQIRVFQSKTGQPLTLPLRPVVGNAILDYIQDERPNKAENNAIFLNATCYDIPLNGDSISDIAHRFYDKLGIRSRKSQNGIRLFRRYLATKLLQKGVTHRYISEILGQTAEKSLIPYIDADSEHLRECALDVSVFPIRKEIFDI